MHLQDELHNPWRWLAPLQNAQKNWALLTYHYCSLHFSTNSTSCPKSSPTSHCSNLKLGPGFLLQHRFVAFNSKPSITTVHDRETCSTGNVHLVLTLPPVVFFLLPPNSILLEPLCSLPSTNLNHNSKWFKLNGNLYLSFNIKLGMWLLMGHHCTLLIRPRHVAFPRKFAHSPFYSGWLISSHQSFPFGAVPSLPIIWVLKVNPLMQNPPASEKKKKIKKQNKKVLEIYSNKKLAGQTHTPTVPNCKFSNSVFFLLSGRCH